MGKTGQRFLTQLAISALVAVATPALAAGVMTAASAVGTAGDTALNPTIAPPSDGAMPSLDTNSSPFIATQGPKRLSALAGSDDAAWESAHSVHVIFAKRAPR